MYLRLEQRTLFLGLLLALGAGTSCDSLKGPELSLTAEPTTIAAGGFESSTITATVLNGGKLAAGVEVYFETDTGSFSDSQDVTYTYVATDANGVASVVLWSPATQGQTEVRASYTDEVSSVEATDQVTVVFGPPQAGNLPVDGKLHLDCPYLNLGAFRQPKPDIQMDCEISAQTVSGDVVPTESLSLHFLAEAGVLESVTDAWNGTTVIRYSVRGGHAAPVDVDPTGGEPSRTGSLGGTRNPRDGVVTLLAIARGSEAWTDLNDNGVRDDNEPFTDLAEPFLDVDDNGTYEEGVDEFFDANGNGQWDDANGQYDADTFIAAPAKVVWTGPIEPDATAGNAAARIETDPTSTAIPDGGSLTLRVFLLDENLNWIAAFGENSDYLELTDSSGYLSFTPSYDVNLTNKLGMDFDTDGSILQFYPDAGLVQVVAHDYDPTSSEDPAVHFSISVAFSTTAGPMGDGYWVDQETAWFVDTVDGSVK